jgi:hypothetical protein
MPKKRATPVIKRFLIEFMLVNCKNDSPTEATRPNRTQCIAAKMGKGIDAKKAPNFLT